MSFVFLWSVTRPPRGGVLPDDESQCWFCLGCPKAELELLVTIGDEVYIAVPKVGKDCRTSLITNYQCRSTTTQSVKT